MDLATVNTTEIAPIADDLVAAFLAGRSAQTLDAYGRDLADFAAWCGAGAAEDAARALLSGTAGQANATALGYKAALIDRGLAPATVNRRLASLRSLVAFGRTVGAINWGLSVTNERVISYRDTAGPGVEGFKAMLVAVERRQDAKGLRDRAILRTLFDLALRVSELVNLDLEHVDLQSGTVSIVGKGRRDRQTLTLSPAATMALRAWILARGQDDGPLFTNDDRAGQGSGRLTRQGVHKLIHKLGADVGLKVWPHGLRHTAITSAVKLAQAAGIGLDEVRDYSRHADLKTLMIYRDRDRNVQGKLAGLVAAAAG